MIRIIALFILVALVFFDFWVSSKFYFSKKKIPKYALLSSIASLGLMAFWIVYSIVEKADIIKSVLCISYAVNAVIRFLQYKDYQKLEKESIVGVIIITEVSDEEKDNFFLE